MVFAISIKMRAWTPRGIDAQSAWLLLPILTKWPALGNFVWQRAMREEFFEPREAMARQP
jgi:hypothetical protein